MLRPRKHIMRKEIKQDSLVTTYIRVQNFAQKHAKVIRIVFGILAVVVVVSIFMIRSKRQSEVAASERLGAVESYFYAKDYSKAIDELSRIVKSYPGTKAAGNAVFYLANSYFNVNDFADAETNFRLYISKYQFNPLFISSSHAGIAACLEQQGKSLEAAKEYEKAGSRFPDQYDAPFHLKEAGRCYQTAGNVEKSKEVYETIQKKYPDSPVTQEVQYLLKSL